MIIRKSTVRNAFEGMIRVYRNSEEYPAEVKVAGEQHIRALANILGIKLEISAIKDFYKENTSLLTNNNSKDQGESD